MEKSLFQFIWKNSARYQLAILLVTLLSYPVSYILLDLPKTITNEAIQGSNFPVEFLGYQLGQIQYLAVLCILFLVLVVVSNCIKLYLNIYKGRLGERMLRQLRFELFQRVLRFRLPHFKKVSSGEIIPMITAEVEDVGGFVGEAFALPAYQGGLLVVQVGFIFMQDPLLGLAAISLYPIQGYIIPKLQQKVVRLSRQRVKNVRVIADKVGETISGISEIHSNDTSAWHSADLSDRLYRNFRIRFDIYNRKYFIKFVNNFMNQLTPFFFYFIGGYLVIKGQLSIGALIAVIAAYKDLAGPWKELLLYYQMTADVSVKYQTVVENFDPPDLYEKQRLLDDQALAFTGPLDMDNLSFSGSGSGQEIHDVSIRVEKGKPLAVTGIDGSGRAELLQMAAGLLSPTSGSVSVNNSNFETLGEATLGRQIAYVGGHLHVWTGTIRDNLFYGLRHRPQETIKYTGSEIAKRQTQLKEAELTLSPSYDLKARWDNYEQANSSSLQELEAKALELCKVAGFSRDLYLLGVETVIDQRHLKEINGGLMPKLVEARKALRESIEGDPRLKNLVEFWDPDKFNLSANLAQNLFFASPKEQFMTIERVPQDPQIRRFLKATGFDIHLTDIGLQIATTMVELFADVSADSDLLNRYSFISREDLPEFERIVQDARNKNHTKRIKENDRDRLIALALKLVPAKHRLGVLDDEMQDKIVAARAQFMETVGKDNARFEFFDPDTYLTTLSIEDNLVFGHARLDRRDARQKIQQVLQDLVRERDLIVPIRRAAFDFHVGVAGAKLSSHQRRLVCLVRALLKNAYIYVLDETANSLSETDKALRADLQELLSDKVLLFGVNNETVSEEFEKTLHLENGRVIER
ncbi:ABC transporter ATP-binding protein/permease [Pseudovibrio sp. Tun.PSC04-5.I4]|uniref:ABC transporter ATP-binding protein/permease n=1 Tax=Pseudovibrio sp. Tun.PSC04-5.I4 TaxID=1798213 RepID=UPI000887A169|nr:ABC transporter ATP-binding protein/permease [Pseudovibrio sp. Tun.PSC04-5.I4]SDQ89990.1 putative ABC transport system ATP-binding protein [Pseudovibrio sp. Tun.PSC04-5.I4]